MNWHFPLAENEKSLYLLFLFLLQKEEEISYAHLALSSLSKCLVCVGASPTTGDEMRVLSLGFVVSVVWLLLLLLLLLCSLAYLTRSLVFVCRAGCESLFSVDKRS